MKMFSNYFLGLFSLYFLLFSPLKATEVIFSCPHGQIPFKVELAKTPQERSKGLMNRETLEADEGMLFLFPEPSAAIMWMKDTPLSLDMIFINKEGKILAIEENTIPHSLEHIGPIENTAQVLEILGGVVQKNNISNKCTVVVKK